MWAVKIKWPLVLGVILAGFVLMPITSFNQEEAADETVDVASIATYDAHFDLARNGDLTVVESVLVSFPVARHGIFRFFDLIDPSAPHSRRVPEDITVRRDGKPEQVDFSERGNGRFRVVRVGSPSVELQGMDAAQALGNANSAQAFSEARKIRTWEAHRDTPCDGETQG